MVLGHETEQVNGDTLRTEPRGISATATQAIIGAILDITRSLRIIQVFLQTDLHSLIGKRNHAAGLRLYFVRSWTSTGP